MKKIATLEGVPRNNELNITGRATKLMHEVCPSCYVSFWCRLTSRVSGEEVYPAVRELRARQTTAPRRVNRRMSWRLRRRMRWLRAAMPMGIRWSWTPEAREWHDGETGGGKEGRVSSCRYASGSPQGRSESAIGFMFRPLRLLSKGIPSGSLVRSSFYGKGKKCKALSIAYPSGPAKCPLIKSSHSPTYDTTDSCSSEILRHLRRQATSSARPSSRNHTPLTALGGASLGETTIGGSSPPASAPPLPSAELSFCSMPTVDNCRMSGRRLAPSHDVLDTRLLLPFQTPLPSGTAPPVDASGVIPAPRGEEKRKLAGRRPWMLCPEVRRDDRAESGFPKDSSEKAVAGVGGVCSRSRPRSNSNSLPRGKGTEVFSGEASRSKRDPALESSDGLMMIPRRLLAISSTTSSPSSTFSISTGSTSSGGLRTSARNSSISRVMASRSSSMVSRDSTTSHWSNVDGQDGSSISL